MQDLIVSSSHLIKVDLLANLIKELVVQLLEFRELVFELGRFVPVRLDQFKEVIVVAARHL